MKFYFAGLRDESTTIERTTKQTLIVPSRIRAYFRRGCPLRVCSTNEKRRDAASRRTPRRRAQIAPDYLHRDPLTSRYVPVIRGSVSYAMPVEKARSKPAILLLFSPFLFSSLFFSSFHSLSVQVSFFLPLPPFASFFPRGMSRVSSSPTTDSRIEVGNFYVSNYFADARIAAAQQRRIVNYQRFFGLFPDHVIINSARCPATLINFNVIRYVMYVLRAATSNSR